MGTMLKLAAALEVPLDDLVEGIEWRPPRGASLGLPGRFRIAPHK
jgi:hypothetical protein